MGWVDPRVGLGWVGNGSKICVFSGLGWVMGLKWQMCEKYMSCIYVTLYRVSTGKFVLWKIASLHHLSEIFILCPLMLVILCVFALLRWALGWWW